MNIKHLGGLLAASTLLAGAVACAGQGGLPSGSTGEPLRPLRVARDINPAPGIVEVELTAAPMQYEFIKGRPTTVLAYNGMLPGPLIECNQGDQVIVHFTNGLDEPTTVHWHGLRLAAAMDGSHLSQEPVPPGGTFTYSFLARDAALFWYHPHHNAQEQLYRGLYGPLLVHGTGEPELQTERILVLSDIGLDAGGQVIPPSQLSDTQMERATGVHGNTQLVNGQILPRLELNPGGTERWRVVNAAGAAYFNLTVPQLQLNLIGTDGGLIEQSVAIESLLLCPGQRADLVLQSQPSQARRSTSITNLSYQHLRLGDHVPEPDRVIAQLHLDDEVAAAEPLSLPLTSLPVLTSDQPERHFGLNAAFKPPIMEGGHGMSAAHDMGGDGAAGDGDLYRFLINLKSFPDIPPFAVRQGTTEIWHLRNHSGMDHPFHIHGIRFQVLDVNGVAPPFRAWYDTYNIDQPASGDDGELRLLVQYDGEPGDWVYHCHVLFHQENGMMGEFTIEP